MTDKKNIVVLDGFAVNPGDLKWDALEALGACVVHDRTGPGERLERAKDADALLVNKVVIDRALMARLPRLRYVGVLATGHNVVDCAAARERGIVVTNVPAYGTASVAQHVFALLLELAQHVASHADAVRNGEWCASRDFCFTKTPLAELDGLTLGVVGWGAIGRRVARIARAFGMNVAAHSRTRFEDPETPWLGLDELFARADVVSLHCPLTPQTERLVNARRLALMKPAALLINTGRGQLLDERAVADALNAGRLAGLGADVLSTEPPAPDNPLLTAKNTVITPHIAWATRAARQRLLDTAVRNLASFFAGAPVNRVDGAEAGGTPAP